MLVTAAEAVGMKVPSDPDKYDRDQFPHFAVFCNAQLGKPMRPGEHWENAKVIAGIPDAKIREVSMAYLVELGFEL